MTKPESFGRRFGALVKSCRLAKGWSLGRLAYEAWGQGKTDFNGKDRSAQIVRVEKGSAANPHATTVEALRKALDIPTETISALRDAPQAPNPALANAPIDLPPREKLLSMKAVLDELLSQYQDNELLAGPALSGNFQNVAPELHRASIAAAQARQELRYAAAIEGLSAAIAAHKDRANTALATTDAHARALRQRARYHVDSGAFLEAASDYHEALSYIPPTDKQTRLESSSAVWFAVAKQMMQLGQYAPARACFHTALTAFQNPTVLAYTVLLNFAPDYATGRAVLDEMIAAGVTPNAVTWSTLLNLAPDYPTGRAVLDEMIEAGVTPNAVTWNTLLNLAPDYPTGRGVLDEMVGKGVTPDAVTASTMAKLVQTMAEADALTDEMLGYRAANPGFFSTIVSRIHPLLSGAELLGWAFGKAKAFKFPFPFAAFEPAIVGYRKKQRFDDALRIILPFPHLPASVAFLNDPRRAELARVYFQARFDEGFECHNASYALARLFAYLKDRQATVEWATIALTYPEQHEKRRADLRAIIAANVAPNR